MRECRLGTSIDCLLDGVKMTDLQVLPLCYSIVQTRYCNTLNRWLQTQLVIVPHTIPASIYNTMISHEQRFQCKSVKTLYMFRYYFLNVGEHNMRHRPTCVHLYYECIHKYRYSEQFCNTCSCIVWELYLKGGSGSLLLTKFHWWLFPLEVLHHHQTDLSWRSSLQNSLSTR